MAAQDPAIECGADFTLTELLASAIGVDASGRRYIRLITTTNVAGSKAFSCGQPVDPLNIEAEIKNIFALDANGDVAIRTGTA